MTSGTTDLSELRGGLTPAFDPAADKVARSKLGKTFGVVAVMTFMSKFVGLARDMVILQAFGAGVITDAFNYANLFAGNTIVLFGGFSEPFHQSTVSILTPRRDSPDAGRLMLQLLAVTAAISASAAFLAWLLAPHVVSWLCCLPALAGQQPLWLKTLAQLYIMLPLVMIAGVVGFLYGVANVYRRLAWTTVSPAIVSLAIIASVMFYKDQAGLCLAWGALYGGVVLLLTQFAMALPYMKLKGRSTTTSGLEPYLRMLWPTALNTAIGQFSVYVDSFFASFIRLGVHAGGAWTAIINANRLVQLPLGVLLTAMILPMLPRFSEHVAHNRIDELKAEFRWSLRLLMFLALPMAGLLLTLSGPILSVLFQRGHFSETDTRLFSQALVWLVPSIIFCIGRDLTTRVFYAYQDSVVPYRIALVAILCKAALDWALIGPLGVGGISLSTSMTTMLSMIFLLAMLQLKIGNLGLAKLLKPFLTMAFASAFASTAAYFVEGWTISYFEHATLVPRLVSLGAAGISAACVYIAFCFSFNLDEPTVLLKRMRSRGSVPKTR